MAPSGGAGGALEMVHRSANSSLPCPLQLGRVADRPEQRAALLEVRAGDLILMATDGVFDNLFDDEIAALLAPPPRRATPRSSSPSTSRAPSPPTLTRRTPFAASA